MITVYPTLGYVYWRQNKLLTITLRTRHKVKGSQPSVALWAVEFSFDPFTAVQLLQQPVRKLFVSDIPDRVDLVDWARKGHMTRPWITMGRNHVAAAEQSATTLFAAKARFVAHFDDHQAEIKILMKITFQKVNTRIHANVK